MIPGPILYYKCPKCRELTGKETIVSGNTLGAVLFSDMKQFAIMLPEFPQITKCIKCRTIFWLDGKNEVRNRRHKPCFFASFLTADGYNESINNRVYRNEEELKFLRVRLWWSYNDRIRKHNRPFYSSNSITDIFMRDDDQIRNHGEIFSTEEDRIIYEDNCVELIGLLDKENISERIMIAELFRNLGNFDECKKIIDSLDEDSVWIKELFNVECNKNNKYVIALEPLKQ